MWVYDFLWGFFCCPVNSLCCLAVSSILLTRVHSCQSGIFSNIISQCFISSGSLLMYTMRYYQSQTYVAEKEDAWVAEYCCQREQAPSETSRTRARTLSTWAATNRKTGESSGEQQCTAEACSRYPGSTCNCCSCFILFSSIRKPTQKTC